MAEEAKPMQLPKAATLLNVSKSTIVEALAKKGIKVEDKPTTKLTPDMLDILMKEFKVDMNIKVESDTVVLGGKKRENIELDVTKSATTVEKNPIESEEIRITSSIVATPDKHKKEETKAPEVVAEPEVIKTVTTKLEGPKVIAKIDLDAKTDNSSKESKTKKSSVGTKPKVEEVAKEAVEEIKIVETKPEPIIIEEETPIVETTEEGNHIETKYEKLDGFKVVGMVDLEKSKPPKKAEPPKTENKGNTSEADKRQRKRIFKSDKPDKIQPAQQDTNRQQRPPAGPGGFNRGPGGFNRGPGGPNRGPGGPNRGPGGFNRNAPAKKTDEVQAVSEKEIEDKIKETMSRLAAATGKSNRAKFKREKRSAHAEEAQKEQDAIQENLLEIAEFISVSELASLMNVSASEVIKTCMNLGVIVSINQRLDAEIIELVAGEFKFEVKFISAADEEFIEDEEEDDPASLVERAPIVTIMGHVDHGKTSLLDYIRKANVVAKEAGGITQHIGAYNVKTPSGKMICFLDTPGHEAFTAMRARGAKLTDIAIIVIAADDQVMPQTKEAISHAQSANVPMIFAFNKIDKPGANADKIREQLSAMNILVEEWGGKFQSAEISAKAGTNIQTLLDKVLLEAEIMELKANPDKSAQGSVIEASLDKGRGYVATILVQSGTLEKGDMIACGPYFGKIKAMYDHTGSIVKNAGPSVPVQILGLNGAPQAGEKFRVYTDEQEAKAIANRRAQIDRETGMRTKKHITLDEIGRRLALGNFKELNLIIKGDVDGSIEALTDSLLKLSTEEVHVNVLHKAVGPINETDVLLASASDAIVIGFQVRPSIQARKIAENEGVEIRTYSIIYNAIEDVKSAMEGLLEPKIEEKVVANIEIRETFKIPKVGTIAGCYVLEGKVSRNNKVRLVRDGIVMYTGELASLKRFKDDVKDVAFGFECGLNIKNYNDIQVGDIVEAFEEVEVMRKL
ncbi:MAG: translation initiation factor IF-2 [Bacteroidota bacterium]